MQKILNISLLFLAVFSVSVIYGIEIVDAQTTGIVTLYGKDSSETGELDKTHVVQIFTTTPLDPNKDMIFQYTDPTQNDHWRVMGDVKKVNQYDEIVGGGLVKNLEFVPKDIGITESGEEYFFRVVVGTGLTKADNTVGYHGASEKQYGAVKQIFKGDKKTTQTSCKRFDPLLILSPTTTNTIEYDRDGKASGTIKYNVIVENRDVNCPIDLQKGFKLEISHSQSPFSAELKETSESKSLCIENCYSGTKSKCDTNCILDNDKKVISIIPLGTDATKFELEVKLSSAKLTPDQKEPIGVRLTNLEAPSYKTTENVPIDIIIEEEKCEDNADLTGNKVDTPLTLIPLTPTKIAPGKRVSYKMTLENTNEGACTDEQNKFTFIPTTEIKDSSGKKALGSDILRTRMDPIEKTVVTGTNFIVPSTPTIGSTANNEKEFLVEFDTFLDTKPDNYVPQLCFLKHFNGDVLCVKGLIKVVATSDSSAPAIGEITTDPKSPTLSDISSTKLNVQVADDVKLKELRVYKSGTTDLNPIKKSLSEPDLQTVTIEASEFQSKGKSFKEGDNSFKIELEDADGKITTKTATITFSDKPNLRITRNLLSTKNVMKNEDFNVIVTAKNSGSKKIDEYTVSLFVDDTLYGKKTIECASTECVSNSKFEGIRFLSAGKHKITTAVLSDVTDVDEEDNIEITTVNVGVSDSVSETDFAEDGSIIAIATGKNNYKIGEDAIVAATLVSDKGAPISGGSVVLELYNPENKLILKTPKTTNEEGGVIFTIGMDSGPEGDWRFAVSHDTGTAQKIIKLGDVETKSDVKVSNEKTSEKDGYLITLKFDKPVYKKGEEITYTGILTKDGKAVSGADIEIEIFKKENKDFEFVAKSSTKQTSSSGKYSGKLQVDAATDIKEIKIIAKSETNSIEIENSFSVLDQVAENTVTYVDIERKAAGVFAAASVKSYKLRDKIPISIGVFLPSGPVGQDTPVKLAFTKEDGDSLDLHLKTNSEGEIRVNPRISAKIDKIIVSAELETEEAGKQSFSETIDLTSA